jgi:leucyl-tRNA synthetase
MRRYNPKDIEPKWQKIWTDSKIYQAIDFDKRPKFVMLTEFPYPSGAGIHIGHSREYTLGDIIARQKRMEGMNVLFPMGYDAFGLPTENYAIKNKVSPQQATDDNVATFQKQLESLGLSFDWSRSFRTSDPEYYKWTQWLFLQFFKKRLAYQAEIAINWCPFCKTGLSNEEVINGRHERCDTPVEKKLLKQWLMKITDYADRLIEGLKTVDYPSRIADQQINWIGRSNGASVTFKVDGSEHEVEVFTTAHDTIYGVTFMVLAPEHELVQEIMTDEHKGSVESYIKMTQTKTDIERQDEGREKTGVFTGAHAINPVNGAKVPIWIADYVLAGYGTGAVMAVPGEDARDHEFAKKYNLPIIYTTDRAEFVDYQTEVKNHRQKFTLANSEEFNGLDFQTGRQKILQKLIDLGVGQEKVQYKLRDWIFSRQHYWGEPIPIIHCPDHGAVAVPDNQLPVTLPKVDHYEPTDTGESPLATITEWVDTTCPICGKPAKRETDTMPNWAGSSWYYLRYFDAHNDQAFADPKKLDYWKDVDLYLGGMEHTTLHLLYSRFWHQFLYDQKLVPTPEPYKARRGQGIILAADGTKMSKSKGNVINPTEVIDSGYGADALRVAIAFIAPYDQTTPWGPEGVAGTFRFLQRIWTLVHEFNESTVGQNDPDFEKDIYRVTHGLIQKVSHDLAELSFNTAIAAQMGAVNELYKLKEQDRFANHESWLFALESLLLVMSPFAPHIAEELWQILGHSESINLNSWPTFDPKYLSSETVVIVIQVNGKLRDQITVATGSDEDAVVKVAKAQPKVKAYLDSAVIKKTIYVPGKLVNFVV